MITASCAELLDGWCRSFAARCPHSTNELLARKDSSATSSQALWRCYAPHTLDDARKHYARGEEYCTRHQQLQHLLDTCMHNSNKFESSTPDQHVPIAATPECRNSKGSCDVTTAFARSSSSSPTVTSPPSSVSSPSLLSSDATFESEGSCSAQAQQEGLDTHSSGPPLHAGFSHECTLTESAEAGSTFEVALASPLDSVQPVGSFPNEIVTIPAFDIGSWSPSPSQELLRLKAWKVGCIDKPEDHTLVNATRNVSRKKAFLRRQGLACFGNCVRAVVDGFASNEETEALRIAIEPTPPAGQRTAISVWRWAPPASPDVFGVLVARAQAVFSDYLGVQNLRFYRANVITWLGHLPMEATTDRIDARAWRNNALHGDTNTDEMFMHTAILYLTTYGAECEGGETGIADAVDAVSSTLVRAGLRVQPSRGRLLLFSAGVENMHEMLPVTRGKRVAMQMWFACDGQLPGWAHAQRVEWERKYGYGGPENAVPSLGKVPDYTSTQLNTRAWEWRDPAGHLRQVAVSKAIQEGS